MQYRTDAQADMPPRRPEPGQRSPSLYLRLIRDYVGGQSRMLAGAILCMLLSSAMTTLLAYSVKPATAGLFLHGAAVMLVPMPVAIFGVLAVRALFTFLQQSLTGAIGERMAVAIQSDIFDSLLRRDLAALNAVHSGQFVATFLHDALLMRDAIIRGAIAFGADFPQVVGLSGLMFFLDWKLAALYLVVLPPTAWSVQKLGATIRHASALGMEEAGGLSTILTEALDGRRVVKAYGLETYVSGIARQRMSAGLQLLLRRIRAASATSPIADLLGGLFIGATLVVAGYQSVHEHLEFDRFASFLAAMFMIHTPVRNLSQTWAVIATGEAAARRAFAVIDDRPTIVDAPDAEALPSGLSATKGTVEFRDVSFSYTPNRLTLDHIDFRVEAGQKVALVGPSGAGKSTVFNLLLRFYDVDSGSVTIDGRDIRNVTLNSLRMNIALVTQDPILFDTSVATNIALGRPGATRSEVESAARAAAAHDFIAALPGGYDTRVGEGGLRLSGGQKQRIAIARALLRDAPILLLDEATSSLDSESERQIQESLAALMKNRTTIIIAHRLSTIQQVDVIHVLDGGRIVESGTHSSLLQRRGLYATLYEGSSV